jgi:hypothetical protein
MVDGIIDQAEPRFVNERGRLQRLSLRLLGEREFRARTGSRK